MKTCDEGEGPDEGPLRLLAKQWMGNLLESAWLGARTVPGGPGDHTVRWRMKRREGGGTWLRAARTRRQES